MQNLTQREVPEPIRFKDAKNQGGAKAESGTFVTAE